MSGDHGEEPPRRDAAALTAAALTQRFHRRLVFYGMRQLGTVTDAEDLAQETLRRVLASLRQERLRDPDAVAGFVLQTARHVALEWRRKLGRERRAMDRFGHDTAQSTPDEALTGLVAAERRRQVRMALDRLGEADRDLLETLYVRDVPMAELAASLGVTPGALRVRKHRALRRLAVALDPGETDQGLR